MSQITHTHAIHHTHAIEDPDELVQPEAVGQGDGLERGATDDSLAWDQWILRSLLIGAAGLLATAIATSLDDIRRYLDIKRM